MHHLLQEVLSFPTIAPPLFLSDVLFVSPEGKTKTKTKTKNQKKILPKGSE